MVAVNLLQEHERRSPAGLTLEISPNILVATTRFGEIVVPQDQLLTILDGILGFEGLQEYCLLEHKPGSPFRWLQSLIEPGLAFVVVNPFDFFPEYEFTINDADEERLQVSNGREVAVLTIVTIRAGTVTTNLVGPIVAHTRRQQAKQLVLSDPRYTTRHSLLLPNA